jgi:hypothetical protein
MHFPPIYKLFYFQIKSKIVCVQSRKKYSLWNVRTYGRGAVRRCPEFKTGPLLTPKIPFWNQGKTAVFTPKLQGGFLDCNLAVKTAIFP